MTPKRQHLVRYASQLAVLLCLASCPGWSAAQSPTLAQAPLTTMKTAPALMLLTMGRDLSFAQTAYNDVSDIDGDGQIDLHFKPNFRYAGYYAPDRCYSYANELFTPAKAATLVVSDPNDRSRDAYKCNMTSTSSALWSGNFMNWLTMSRIDVLRRVLYGGMRSTDTTKATVLERAYVPQDSSLWGKDYQSIARDGYDLREFTPLALPKPVGNYHHFANTTLLSGRSGNYSTALNPPSLFVYQNQSGRLWDLVATERLILGDSPGGSSVTRYTVRVATCVALDGNYEDDCLPYPRSGTGTVYYKPTGLLHQYAENKTLAFGLLTGSYDNNYSGGVLRQNIDDFDQEVNAKNGTFTSVKGIVYHLNTIRPWGFGHDADYAMWDCGFHFGADRLNGECPMWGNPLGEMMYEGLRYFAAAGPTSAYTAGLAQDRSSYAKYPGVISAVSTLKSPEPSARLNLQTPAWINPYVDSSARSHSSAYPTCSRPVQMVIGDPKTSFDSDQLPGSFFNVKPGYGPPFSGSLDLLDVSREADAIWAAEFGAGSTRKFFIGESNGDSDGNPSAKVVNSFKSIRGHAPDATTAQGSYYGAAVARYGRFTGVRNPATGSAPLEVKQISVALNSNVPQLRVPVAGRTVQIVPMQKTVGGCGLPLNQNQRGGWQNTDQITAFFVDKMANTDASNLDPGINGGRPYYLLRVSYSDLDQGTDNETDLIANYEIKVTAGQQLSLGLSIQSVSTCASLHLGYVISGTSADGVYLDVATTGGGPPATGYFLDTLPGASPGSAMHYGTAANNYADITTRLPMSTVNAPRLFSVGASNGGEYVPHDMLWYAAKYGGARKGIQGDYGFVYQPNGDPESYFFASNPSLLSSQLGQAFQQAAALAASTSTALSGNGARVGDGTRVFQGSYDTLHWGGNLMAFHVGSTGMVADDPLWDAAARLPAPQARKVVLGFGGTRNFPVGPDSFVNPPSMLSSSERLGLQTDFGDSATFQYLLGDRSQEQNYGGRLRIRSSALGDTVNSDPVYVGSGDFGFADDAYASFKPNAPQLVGFGSNDGLYHRLSAQDGVERLAFMPLGARARLRELSYPAYEHRYYVDGPSAFGHVKLSSGWRSVVAGSLGAGGKSVFAIDVTTAGSESVLWEYSADFNLDADLGYVLGKPVVGMLEGSKPVVLVPNGLGSVTGKAALLLINPQTGKLIRSCRPGNAANTTANGMTTITALSMNKNGVINLVYGADYKGNIWRIDPNDSGCSTGATLVFASKDAAGTAQPITGELSLTSPPGGKSGYMLLFGTGSYLTQADPSNTQVQTLYGVWDDLGNSSITRAKLVAQSIAPLNPDSTGTRTTSSAIPGQDWYQLSGKKGWLLDLQCSGCAPGERSIATPALIGQGATLRVYFLTMVPGLDPCQIGGGGWITGLNPLTGTYVKGFAGIPENSTYLAGASPRGMYLAQRTPTADSRTSDLLYVSFNISNNKTPQARGAIGYGAMQAPGDGSGTGMATFDISQPPAAGLGWRRQVWRQIQ